MCQVVTVCTANLCRSPLAAAALVSAFGRSEVQVAVSSAGVDAVDGARAPTAWLELVAEFGFDLAPHRSAPVSAVAPGATLIVAMTADHARAIASMRPELLGWICLLGQLAADPPRVLADVASQRAFDLLRLDGRFDIPDPVRQPARTQRSIAQRIIDLSGQVARGWPR